MEARGPRPPGDPRDEDTPGPRAPRPAPAEAPAGRKYAVEEVNRALVAVAGRPRTVLDVGCGIGLNGAAVKRTGARVTGIEVAPASLARAGEALDEVLAADITDRKSVV